METAGSRTERFIQGCDIGELYTSGLYTLDNHSDVDLKVGRMNCHQIFGWWNGDVTLDDGTKIEIKDLFTFCEYVENRW